MLPRRVCFAALLILLATGLRAQASPPAPKHGQPAFDKWLNEEVVYIITSEERDKALQLQTDRERREFVKQFWWRRQEFMAPEKNAFAYRKEHYRRLAFANTHFASHVPGWKTDRGRIYIMFGPPDEIEAHPGGGGKPGSELWHYRYVEGIGDNFNLNFADREGTGDYVLTNEPPLPQFLRN